GDFLSARRRNENPRRSFMKKEKFGAQSAGKIHFCADFCRPETAFGESNSQAAIAQVVDGFRQAFVDDSANCLLNAPLIFHVERRRQTPQRIENHLGVLGTSKALMVATPVAAEQHNGAARVLKPWGSGPGGLHQADNP